MTRPAAPGAGHGAARDAGAPPAFEVLIPTPLRSYTGAARAGAAGRTLGELLADLDRRHPGLRFRMVDEHDRLRPHMRVFVDGRAVHDLGCPLRGGEAVAIVQALSGG